MNNNKFYKIGVAVSVLLIGVIVACIVIAQKQDDKVAKAEDFPSVSSSTNVVENEVNVAEQTDFEEIGLIAWEFIGNKEVKMYKINLKVDPITHTVELPCNVFELEAVTYPYEDWNYTSNKYALGDINSLFTENFIEGAKANKHSLYTSGKFAKYEQVGSTLYFDSTVQYVNILYKGIYLDDNGLPRLDQKESIAIATYCAYLKAAKEYYATMNQQIFQKLCF